MEQKAVYISVIKIVLVLSLELLDLLWLLSSSQQIKIQEDAYLKFLETIEMKLNKYLTEKTMTIPSYLKWLIKKNQQCSSLKQTRQALSRTWLEVGY